MSRVSVEASPPSDDQKISTPDQPTAVLTAEAFRCGLDTDDAATRYGIAQEADVRRSSKRIDGRKDFRLVHRDDDVARHVEEVVGQSREPGTLFIRG